MESDNFFEDENEEDKGTNTVEEYDITLSPRDLTPASIVDMIENGIMEIPLFQRNYVWDISKASRLIESLILGLPIPELFFYSEGDENTTYKIIDGQQRLLSIYFFIKGRFPKTSISRIFMRKKVNTATDFDSFLADNSLFKDFELKLNSDKDGVKSRYHGLKFATLDKNTQIKFRLRRFLRTVVVRQNKPEKNNASMFEIFNRLNTGGVALTDQEVRASVYNCDFYQMLALLNEEQKWRDILGKPSEDLHSNDIEMILRAIALLVKEKEYSPKMASFLNLFSQESKSFPEDYINYIKDLYLSFIDSCAELGARAFFRNNRFSKPFFESVFVATCKPAYKQKTLVKGKITKESLELLKNDATFITYMQSGSSSSDSINNRIARAEALLEVEED